MILIENPIKLLQYNIIHGTSISLKYTERMSRISVSIINAFIASLCYNLPFYDVLRSRVLNTSYAIMIKKLRIQHHFQLVNFNY